MAKQDKYKICSMFYPWAENKKRELQLNTFADVIRLLPPELVEYVQKKLVRMLASLEDDDKANDTPTSS